MATTNWDKFSESVMREHYRLFFVCIVFSWISLYEFKVYIY
ncbi:hypothetical protein DYBT9275_03622 [Dyadobacter sp. CECT 9275]|uniref:Uncharacterized protein n=1 Tax=Dyadobacter helix TaxID=2822344 RepID=A0A916JDR8_9BACT|nr:hypothetical protein DYBT9275_03622 [Dyadobacter sp. CECT 9275]